MFWFWTIDDQKSCEQAIRWGGVAVLVMAAARAYLAYAVDPAFIPGVVLITVLGIFLFRKNRVASTLLVAYLVISIISVSHETGSSGLSFILFLACIRAMRGTYIWHSSYKPKGEVALAGPFTNPPAENVQPESHSVNWKQVLLSCVLITIVVPVVIGVPIVFVNAFMAAVGQPESAWISTMATEMEGLLTLVVNFYIFLRYARRQIYKTWEIVAMIWLAVSVANVLVGFFFSEFILADILLFSLLLAITAVAGTAAGIHTRS